MIQQDYESSLRRLAQRYTELLSTRLNNLSEYLQAVKEKKETFSNTLNLSVLEEALKWLEEGIEYKSRISPSLDQPVGIRNIEVIMNYLRFYDNLLHTISYFLHQIDIGSSTTFPQLIMFVQGYLRKFDIENPVIISVGSEFSIYNPAQIALTFENVFGDELSNKMKELPIFISIPLLDAKNWKKLPLLIHEAAHLIDYEKGITNDVINELQASRLDPTFSRIALYWTQEVVADLLAVRYLGPSYLKAFLNSPDFLITDTFGETHPPINDRLRILISEIQEMGFDINALYYDTMQIVTLLPAISLDQRYSNIISEHVKQKCNEFQVTISHIELKNDFLTIQNNLNNGRLALFDPSLLLNVAYDNINHEIIKAALERSIVAQYLRQYLGSEIDTDEFFLLGLEDLAIKIQLAEFWYKAVKSRESTPSEKGIALENYFRAFLNSIQDIEVTQVRMKTRTREIDIIADIIGERWHTYSPYIIVECKNISNRVNVSQLRDFVVKLDTSHNVKLGIYVSTSGFTRVVKDELLRLISKPYTIMLIEGTELDEFHMSSETTEEFFIRKIRESVFR